MSSIQSIQVLTMDSLVAMKIIFNTHPLVNQSPANAIYFPPATSHVSFHHRSRLSTARFLTIIFTPRSIQTFYNPTLSHHLPPPPRHPILPPFTLLSKTPKPWTPTTSSIPPAPPAPESAS